MHSNFAQQTATAAATPAVPNPNPNETTAAAGSMPTPSNEPWSLSTMPWYNDELPPGGIMQFKARPHMDEVHRLNLHQKRKSKFPDIIPTKQFISEEKITAHFNGLHISSDYIQNQNNASASCSGSTISSNNESVLNVDNSGFGCDFSNLTFADYQMTSKQLEEKLKNASRITINNEVKKYHEEQKKIAFLVSKTLHVEEPCKAVVLWQPQAPILEIFKKHKDSKEPKEMDADAAEEEVESQQLRDHIQMLEDCLEAPLPVVADDEFDEVQYNNNNTCNVDLNNGMDVDF